MDSNSFVILLFLYVAGFLFLVVFVEIFTKLATGSLVIAVILYLIKSRFFTKDRLPFLCHAETRLANHVIQHCKRLREPFRPPYWARNHHVQTILPAMLPKPDFKFKREFFDLNDGGVLALDYGISGTDSLKSNSPVLLIVPGLNGDADSVAHLCRIAVCRGFFPVVYNKRGHAETPLTTPKMLSSGDPSDLREAVQFLKKANPHSEIAAAAYSAGSLLLRSYLGEYGASCGITVAVCNSPGYQHQRLFQKLIQPYDFVLLKGLKQTLRRHQSVLSEVIDVDAVFRARRVLEFEELLYCKMFSYKDMDEYCNINDSPEKVAKAVTPFLCINSADDPICIKELFPYDFFQKQSNVMLAVTSEGGHCGFVERSTWSHWADELALDYIEAVMDFNKTQKMV